MTVKTRIEKLEKRSRAGGMKHIFVHHEGEPTQGLEEFKARYPDDENRIVFNVFHEEATFKNDAPLKLIEA